MMLTETTRDAINWMLACHEPIEIIATTTGVSRVTVTKLRHAYLGTHPVARTRRPRIAPETRTDVARRLYAGDDRTAIAKATGVSRMYVRKVEREIRR